MESVPLPSQRLETLFGKIDAQLRDPDAHGQLRHMARALIIPHTSRDDATTDEIAERLLLFIVAGRYAASALVATAEREMEAPQIQVAALLTEYWANRFDAIPDAAGLLGRVDDAYLSARLLLGWTAPASDQTQDAAEILEQFHRHSRVVSHRMAPAESAGTVHERAMSMIAFVEQCLGPKLVEELNSWLARSVRPNHVLLARGRDIDTAWQLLAALPAPKQSAHIDLSTLARDAGAFRAAVPPAASTHSDTSTERSSPPSENGARQYDVWFGTNRQPVDGNDLSRGFANELDPNDAVHYGVCSVDVPRTHLFGSLGTPFWRRWLRLEFTDDSLRLHAIRPFVSNDDFFVAIRDELATQAIGSRCVLIYLHGFNVSFEEAALRAAQIGFDLKVPGATAFFSWPSKAETSEYPADIARIEASEAQIADFITAVAARSGAEVVHVIAHSMGNRGFARAIARITQATGDGVRFGQIILAAPDLDVHLFRQLASVYPRISRRTTMYVSAKDKALAMSKWLQDSDRAGFTPPVTVVDGIDTIEVTQIDVSLLGHGYYAEAEPVLYDIKDLIDSDKPPSRRMRTEARTSAGTSYWAIRK